MMNTYDVVVQIEGRRPEGCADSQTVEKTVEAKNARLARGRAVRSALKHEFAGWDVESFYADVVEIYK